MIWLGWSLAVLLGAAGAAVVLRRDPVGADRAFRLLVAAGCGLGLVPALRSLGGVHPATDAVHLGPWAFGVDPLSAWFLLIVLAVGGTVIWYGAAYLAPERGHRDVTGAHLLVVVLLIALGAVVTARSVVAFLVAWEIMALSAYLLVIFEKENPEVRRAGFLYLLLTHLSTLALIAAFAAAVAPGADGSFEAIAQRRAELPGAGAFLGFALIGFGIKAGGVPLHFWLPGAHAAAPSHASALFSGVMIKTGIYGLLRVLALVGQPPAWWGWALLGAGVGSGILGVLWAIAQHDLKRLLAYHSVENIGIILLGLGIGVLGVAYRHPLVAALGLVGALLHTLNHALFKSLLFLSAGAIARATGSREIDRHGGIARPMPATALLFTIGAVAIVGLPPLNGFVSEWIIFVGLLHAGQAGDATRLAAAATAGLALIGGLALLCFAKVTGIVFLGHPRSGATHAAADPGPGMIGPMVALAIGCAAIGLVPGLVVPAAWRVASALVPLPGADLVIAGQSGLISILGLTLVAMTGILFLLRRSRQPAAARIPTWACGASPDPGRTQYTASSFAAPLLATFGPAGGLRESRTDGGYHSHPIDPVLDGAVRPIWRRIDDAAHRVRALQAGRIRWYLLAVVLTLLLLLIRLATRGVVR